MEENSTDLGNLFDVDRSSGFNHAAIQLITHIPGTNGLEAMVIDTNSITLKEYRIPYNGQSFNFSKPLGLCLHRKEVFQVKQP